MITIQDYSYNRVCDLEGRGKAKHSIGRVGAPMVMRTNICTQCLKEIIVEGLARLSPEEKAEVLAACDIQDLQNQPKIEEKDTSNINTHEERESPENDLNSMSRQELIALAKEKGVEGKLITMKTSKLIEAIQAAK